VFLICFPVNVGQVLPSLETSLGVFFMQFNVASGYDFIMHSTALSVSSVRQVVAAQVQAAA
jgi:hypothetical protein